ncbi:alpha/beta-hydrolase, partial [Aureobasidium melanogenum]
MLDPANPQPQKQLGKIAPELEEYLKTHRPPQISFVDYKNVRKARADAEKKLAAESPTYNTKESVHAIFMRDGYGSEIVVTSPPKTPADGSPLVALIFGGGWAIGTAYQQIPYARSLSALYDATVVTLSYRLAPEHPFPIAQNDVYDSVIWLGQNASTLGADVSAGWILGGVSAGGSMTATTAQKMVNNKVSPPLTGMWICVPNILHASIVPDKYKSALVSREQNSEVPGLSMKDLDFLDTLMEQDITTADWSPFNARNPHKNMPPAYFQVCGMDPLRDDGLIYEAVLREHGNSTKIDVYPGVPHVHFSIYPQLKSSRAARLDVLKGFGWLLNKRVSLDVIESMEPAAPAGG